MSYVIVGGGLAGSLAALALADAGRGRDLVLIEPGRSLGGNHTWSFHETDLDEGQRGLVMPLVSWRWPRQIVRFPTHARTLEIGYLSVSSERFGMLVRGRLERAGVRVLLGERAVDVTGRDVRLGSGAILEADVVLDARGTAGGVIRGDGARTAYQKFVGLELDLDRDGPWEVPVVMDATVDQTDGFRFVYVLPFSRRHVLVEDTVYAEHGALDVGAFERRALEYAERHGVGIRRVMRREAGVLPLSLTDWPAAPPRDVDEGPIAIGYRGGFFHPATGYSLPAAARVALAVARAADRHETRLKLAAISRDLAPQRRFQQRLNRLLFDAMPGAERWRAFARFYRLPAPTIERFFASHNTLWDRARVLVGRPPAGISLRRAFATAWRSG
jgi:lycopene beta-cyclase